MRRLSIGLVLLAACSASRDESATSEAAATARSSELTPAVGTLVASGPSSNPQQEPAIAKSNGQYLAVWVEEQAIRAMRLDDQGKPLDDRSLLVSDGGMAGWEEAPSVAASGDDYLVVWKHAETNGPSVRAARIERDGHVVPSVMLADTAIEPSVAWNGSSQEYLVAWTAAAGASSIRAARVSKAGAIGTDFAVSAAGPLRCSRSSIAASKQTFLVAWEEPHGVRAKRLGVDVAPFLVIDHGGAPAVASDGSSFWVATHPARGVDLTPVRDGIAGTTLSIDGDTIGEPAVAWDGDALIVAWEDQARRVKDQAIAALPLPERGNRLRPAVADAKMILRSSHDAVTTYLATPDGTPIARGDATQRAPVAAFDGRRYLVVWEELRTDFGHPEIWASFVKDAVPNPPFRLGDGEQPSVAWDGMKYIAVWRADAAHSATVSIDYEGTQGAATLVDAVGAARIVTGGGNSFLLVNGGQMVMSATTPSRVLYTQEEPLEVVWDGTSFLAAWTHGGTANAAHFTSSWQRVEPAPLEIASVDPGTDLHVAGDDHGTALVAWDTGQGIVGKRVGTTVLDSYALRLDGTLDTKSCNTPALAFDGDQWLTAYRTQGEVELTHLGADARRSAALTLGTGSVTMTSGPAHETLFALESGSRVALRVLRDVRPATTEPPPVSPPAPGDDDDTAPEEHGAPAFKAPAARPGKAAAPPSAAPASDGCAMSPRGGASSMNVVGLTFALALLVRRRFARRARVPHARR